MIEEFKLIAELLQSAGEGVFWVAIMYFGTVYLKLFLWIGVAVFFIHTVFSMFRHISICWRAVDGWGRRFGTRMNTESDAERIVAMVEKTMAERDEFRKRLEELGKTTYIQ